MVPCHALPPPWQGLPSPADTTPTSYEDALRNRTCGTVAASLDANLEDDPRHRTGSAVLALYIELQLVPTAAAALKDAARYALACPAPPEGCTDDKVLLECRNFAVRVQSRVLAVGQVFSWALTAVRQALCVEGRKAQARKHARLVLQQLSQNDTWQSLAESCVRLFPRLLPEQPVSTPSSQPLHIVQQWAQVLEEAVRNGAGSVVAPAQSSGNSSQRRRADRPVGDATRDASERDMIESGTLVLEKAAILVSEAVHCAVEVLGISDAAGHKAGEGLLRSLLATSLMDTLSSCLLRVDPARPPRLGSNANDCVLSAVMAATRSIMDSVRTATAAQVYGQPSQPPDAHVPPGTLELRMQLATQPHVLQLLHAVLESFLQDPPPLSSVGFGSSGTPADSSAATTAAATADRKPAWEAFLPSASPSDALSNKMLQKAWPLLAACPFVRHMYRARLSELDALEVKQLSVASEFVNNVLMWTLPFTEPGPKHSAIRAALPGLSGFSRIAARAARWCAFATVLVARAAAKGAKGAPAPAELLRIACMTIGLVTCLENWQKVSAAFGQVPCSHASCALRGTLLSCPASVAPPGCSGVGAHGMCNSYLHTPARAPEHPTRPAGALLGCPQRPASGRVARWDSLPDAECSRPFIIAGQGSDVAPAQKGIYTHARAHVYI